MVKIVLLVIAVLAFLGFLVSLADMKTIFQQMVVMVLLLIGTVALSGAGIISAINALQAGDSVSKVKEQPDLGKTFKTTAKGWK